VSRTPNPTSRIARIVSVLARSIALFFCVFSAIGLFDTLRGFDPNIWWIDLRFLPGPLAQVLLVVSAALLLGFALRPAISGWRRAATMLVCALLAAIALYNGIAFYQVWSAGLIRPAWPVPLSFVIAAAFGGLAVAAWRAHQVPPRGAVLRVVAILSCAALWAFAFPLAQQFFFGETDYARPAQAAVVPGAQVFADGRPTIALKGRVLTAVALYKRGLVHTLVFSGGRNGITSQVAAMRSLALQQGVPASAVLCDYQGVNTAATVRDTVPMLRAHDLRRVIVVSDFYHLPRLKLAYASAGLDVLTVPAKGGAWIRQTPFLIVRDDAGFWVYLLRETA
jgi:vancomycin permeability regulator SanA